MVAQFDLDIKSDLTIYDSNTLARREKRAAFAAAYFIGRRQTALDCVVQLIIDSAPIIPIVRSDKILAGDIPDMLRSLNSVTIPQNNSSMTGVAAALLECIGLLRRQRRAFVSYRRAESRAAAMQLHDSIASRGFDVFLDTHDIRPGDRFEDIMWQRLCDSDVMVMLDTPSYFEGKWTSTEVGRALAKGIHVLRVVLPGHQPNKLGEIAETIYLNSTDLVDIDGPLVTGAAERVVLAIESIRSRSIASRYMSITGKLRVEIQKISGQVEGIGAHRAIAIRLQNGRKLWAYPVVGVPSAEALYDVAVEARRLNQRGTPILVYDHVGIQDGWSAHLRWLDDNIGSVKAIKVYDVGWVLAAGWEG